MKCCHGSTLKKLLCVIALAGVILTCVATVAMFLKKKKKDEAELEEYLDCAIE